MTTEVLKYIFLRKQDSSAKFNVERVLRRSPVVNFREVPEYQDEGSVLACWKLLPLLMVPLELTPSAFPRSRTSSIRNCFGIQRYHIESMR
jgi:hypothetical protein